MLVTQKVQTILFSVFGLLLIPLIAMQFTIEVNWNFADFFIDAILLFSLAFSIDFIFRKVKSKSHKILIIASFLIAFLLLWAELAVGIFGTPFAGS